MFDPKAVHVYAVEVSDRLAADLRAAWATWGEGGATEAPSQPKGKTALRV
ncbi:MAG: hypothetical protein JW959_07065 [Pirellulales bacterium]|nr:hypothetical protein [Pirellulales bacterium]